MKRLIFVALIGILCVQWGFAQNTKQAKQQRVVDSLQLENKRLKKYADRLERQLFLAQYNEKRLKFKKYYATERVRTICEKWNECRVWAEAQAALSIDFKILSVQGHDHSWDPFADCRESLDVVYVCKGRKLFKKFKNVTLFFYLSPSEKD